MVGSSLSRVDESVLVTTGCEDDGDLIAGDEEEESLEGTCLLDCNEEEAGLMREGLMDD